MLNNVALTADPTWDPQSNGSENDSLYRYFMYGIGGHFTLAFFRPLQSRISNYIIIIIITIIIIIITIIIIIINIIITISYYFIYFMCIWIDSSYFLHPYIYIYNHPIYKRCFMLISTCLISFKTT